MADPQEDPLAYLRNLLQQHQASVSVVGDFITNKTEQFQQRISEGGFNIRTVKYKLSPAHDNQLVSTEQLVANRWDLQSKMRELGSIMKREEGYWQGKGQLSEQERTKFVRQMRMEQQFLVKRREASLRDREEQRKAEEQKKREKQERELAEKRERRRLQIERRIQQIENESERRGEQIKEQNRQYQAILHERTLLHKMQQEFNRAQNEELEEKKRKLASIRAMHQPLTKEDLLDHQSRIKEYQTMKEEEKQFYGQSRSTNSIPRFYKSHWYKEVIKEEKKQDDTKKESEDKQIVKALRDKQVKYGQHVRQTMLPDIDQKLAADVIKRHPKPKKVIGFRGMREMGIKNLKYSKEKNIPKEERTSKHEQQQAMKVSSPLPAKPANYLEEMRSNRKAHSQSDTKIRVFDRHDSDQKKLESMKQYAQRLEKSLTEHDKKRGRKKQALDEQGDNMIMQALNAKLALLND